MFSVVLLGSCTILVPAIATPIEYINKKNNPEKIKFPKKNYNYTTHNEYMSNIKLKRDVISKWGAPTKKDTLEGLEIWYYSLAEEYSSKSKGSATGVALANSVYGSSSSTTLVSERYVEFQFENDIVVNWRSKGLDYSSTGKKTNIEGAKPRVLLLLIRNFAIGTVIDLFFNLLFL